MGSDLLHFSSGLRKNCARTWLMMISQSQSRQVIKLLITDHPAIMPI